eukprot:Mrub_04839.p1 GENE.Mrub_04839~~Mrub_04839.p1  ORF type:complete len:204 (-),score=19.52 Mrub_04839:87-698(-)
MDWPSSATDIRVQQYENQYPCARLYKYYQTTKHQCQSFHGQQNFYKNIDSNHEPVGGIVSKDHNGRFLENFLLNKNIKKTEYQRKYDIYSQYKAYRLSKLKEIKIKEEEKKQIEKSQWSKLQNSMKDLFSDVHTKIANQAYKNQSRVIKHKRESQEPYEDNTYIINKQEEFEELELPSDDEDSDYEKKYTYKQKRMRKRRGKC